MERGIANRDCQILKSESHLKFAFKENNNLPFAKFIFYELIMSSIIEYGNESPKHPIVVVTK